MIGSRKSWQEHLGALSLNERCDTAVYATQWAQGPQWMRTEPSQRRARKAQNPLHLFALHLLALKR